MELTLDQALQKGVEAHKAGKVQEADRYYTAILKASPKHPDANHNMGVLAVGVGKVEQALPFFKTALEVNPKIAQFWLSYINALIKLGRTTDAKAVFDQAKSNGAKGKGFEQIQLRLNPSSIELKNTTPKAVSAQPNILDDLKLDKALTLANKKVKDGLSEEAKKIYQDILEKFSRNKRALDGIKKLATKTLANTSEMQEPPIDQLQGLVSLYTRGQYEEVLGKVSQLQEQFPRSGNLFNIIGLAKKSLGRLEEAIEAYTKALSVKPDNAELYNNMGIALKDQGKLEEAIEAYTKALSIKPDNAKAYNNMGNALKDQGKLEEAIEAYTKALSIKPDYANAIENALYLRNQISDKELINEEFEKILKTRSPELREMPKFQIIKAIGAFLLSDQKLVRKHLSSYASFTPSSIAKLNSEDQVFCSAYNSFLQKLIEEPLVNQTAIANDQTVFHLGESHCLSYAHRLIKIHGKNYMITPRIIFGGKAYHFSTGQENVYQAITKSNFASLPDSSTVFLSFGEIDCRPNEGFISAAKKHKKPIEDLVSDTVRGYVGWFVEQNKSNNHRLFFFNVPAPSYIEKYGLEVNGEVTRTIKLFNSLLHKTVLEHNFGMIDVYKFTVGKDEHSNGIFHIDDRHLSSHAIPEIEKQIGTLP